MSSCMRCCVARGRGGSTVFCYLRAGDSEDALVMQAEKVDDADAALDDQRDVLARRLDILLEAAAKQLRLPGKQGPPDAAAGVGDRPRQGGRGARRALVPQTLADVVVLCLQPRDPIAVEDVLPELGEVELLRLLPVHLLLGGEGLGLPLLPGGLLFHKVSKI